jgi:CubicO group peptidase (beta-lactamase class C family)
VGKKISGEGEEFEGCPIGPGIKCPGIGSFGYTYQTWRTPCGKSVFFLGKYGQMIMFTPSTNIAVVILSTTKSGKLQHLFTKELISLLLQINKDT